MSSRVKEASPYTLSCPHFRGFLSVLFSKHNCQFTAKKNLPIHMVFSIFSISWVYKLDKTKATWLPETTPCSSNLSRSAQVHIHLLTINKTISNLTALVLCNNIRSTCSHFIQLKQKHHVAANLVVTKDKIEMKFFRMNFFSMYSNPSSLRIFMNIKIILNTLNYLIDLFNTTLLLLHCCLQHSILLH